MTDIERLTAIQSRIDEINRKKITAQAELTMLKTQYNEKVAEFSTYGITDISNLPDTIARLKSDLEIKLSTVESKLTEIESALCAQ